MSQDLCENKENKHHEICRLMKYLKKNEDKLSSNIKSIYEDLDLMTKNNKEVTIKLANSVRPVKIGAINEKEEKTEETKGGGKKNKTEKGLNQFITLLFKTFKKDKDWKKRFRTELRHEGIHDIFDLKNSIYNNEEFSKYIAEEYELDIDIIKKMIDTPKYGKFVVERYNCITYITKLIEHFNIKQKDDIYQFSNQRLYKRLSIMIRTYKDKIPEKIQTAMIKDFNLQHEVLYLLTQLTDVYENQLQDQLKRMIYSCENTYKIALNKKSELLDQINQRETRIFIKKTAKIIKKFFHNKLIKIEFNLEKSGIGKKYYKISTEDGKINVGDIDKDFFHNIIELVKIDYEKYLNSISIHGIPHTFELPEEKLKLIDTKLNADSMFSSIAYCLSDPILLNKIEEICNKNASTNDTINYFKNNLKYFKQVKTDSISMVHMGRAQQVLRMIISQHIPEYLSKYTHLLKLIKLSSEQAEDYKIYKNLDFPVNFSDYSGISKIEQTEIIQNFQNLVLVSETNNIETDLEDIYWGDHISMGILTDFLNKYFDILVISISATKDKFSDGFYVYSHHQLRNIKKSKYSILLCHSPRTIDAFGTQYQSIIFGKNKDKFLNIDFGSKQYKNYNDSLKDFIDDVLY